MRVIVIADDDMAEVYVDGDVYCSPECDAAYVVDNLGINPKDAIALGNPSDERKWSVAEYIEFALKMLTDPRSEKQRKKKSRAAGQCDTLDKYFIDRRK